MLCFNFFFLPPVGTLTIADPQNWVALFAFLAVSLVASHLSTVARARTEEAIGAARRAGAAVRPQSRRAGHHRQPRGDRRRSRARSPAGSTWSSSRIALPRAGEWDVFEAGAGDDRPGSPRAARRPLPRPRPRSSSTPTRGPMPATGPWRSTAARSGSCRCASGPSRLACWPRRPADRGRHARHARRRRRDRHRARAVPRGAQGGRADAPERGAEDRAAGVARARPAHAADGHSRRGQQHPGAALDRRRAAEQSDLILSEVERLTRLFQNILEMARIDAGAIADRDRGGRIRRRSSRRRATRWSTRCSRTRWTCTSTRTCPVRLDPRLTATALAHLLENAAQYSPAGSTITSRASVTDEGLVDQRSRSRSGHRAG